jgi:hypothetical protein
MRFIRAALVTIVMAGSSACVRPPVNGEGDVRPTPVPLHVINENYLDVNVVVVSGGTRRRLGTVSGNSTGDFLIDWNLAEGRPITLLGTPIGGAGFASSGSLSIGPSEAIDFKIAATLRQSTASVHSR